METQHFCFFLLLCHVFVAQILKLSGWLHRGSHGIAEAPLYHFIFVTATDDASVCFVCAMTFVEPRE